MITVSDPCCGAGCLLIAFANEARSAGIDYQSRIVFFAQDVDLVAAMMCYIQLSLLGCQAIVKVGDSLANPFAEGEPISPDMWLTPVLALNKQKKI